MPFGGFFPLAVVVGLGAVDGALVAVDAVDVAVVGGGASMAAGVAVGAGLEGSTDGAVVLEVSAGAVSGGAAALPEVDASR